MRPPVAKTGYLNFGSFFTEPVEELILQACREVYIPPSLPFGTDDLLDPDIINENLDLGRPTRQLFMVMHHVVHTECMAVPCSPYCRMHRSTLTLGHFSMLGPLEAYVYPLTLRRPGGESTAKGNL